MDAGHLLDINGRTPITVRSDESVREAVHKLVSHNIGALPVVDADGRLVGIVSERDIARGLDGLGAAFVDQLIGELVKRRVITCAPHDSIVDIVLLMKDQHIRHMPVVDGDQLVGVISIRDVMGAWMGAIEEENRQLRDPAAV